MTKKNNLSRRQFVKKTVAVAGITAVTATAVSSLQACPISFDKDGKRADWFCIIDIDDSHPVFTIYTWKNCATGETFETFGNGGQPLGICKNASSDPSCVLGLEIENWAQFNNGEKVYGIMPGTSEKVRETAIRTLISTNSKRR